MQTKFLMLVNLLKTDYNAKIIEIENKIPSISGLATNSAPTAVENKVPNLNLVSAIFYQIFIFSPNDSPSKTMKNVFYFI